MLWDRKILKEERGRAVSAPREELGIRHARALRKGRSFPSRAPMVPPPPNSHLLRYVVKPLEAA